MSRTQHLTHMRHAIVAATAAAAVAALAGIAGPLAPVLGQGYPPVGSLPGRIVYTRAASNPSDFAIDVFVSDASGENERQLTNTVDSRVYGSARGEDQPRWSPDGAEIAFTTANKDGLVSIWRVPALGGTPTPVVSNDGEGGDPSWQPDGLCIVYAGAHTGGDSTLDLRRSCRDGTTTTIQNTNDADERGPDVSPDGRRIVYQSRRPPRSYADRPEWALRTMNADGTEDALLYAPAQGSAMYPRWSPDMSRIAFVAGRLEGIGSLAVIDLVTREVTVLASLAAGPLSWSPDGSQVMFYNTDAAGPRTLRSASLAEAYARQEPQLLGLYVYSRRTGQLERLLGAAGGASAKADSYQWGYAPDWWAPSPTPTMTATDTATPSPTPTATATATATATSTPEVGLTIYVPLASKSVPLGDR